jgi:hypothetical protein
VSQFGEDRCEPMPWVEIYAEFVVAASEILDERVSGTDRPCRAESFQTAHLPVLDDYLQFVAARARPNTVVATAYDLAVFFRVVSKPPVEVTSADVLGFITAQRIGSDGHQLCVVTDGVGLSARMVRRRLCSVVRAVCLPAGSG